MRLSRPRIGAPLDSVCSAARMKSFVISRDPRPMHPSKPAAPRDGLTRPDLTRPISPELDFAVRGRKAT